MAVELSVIIPCYGHGAELIACLNSLTAQRASFDYEVIVVDSSPDPSIASLSVQFPQIRLIRSQTRLFPGKARNLGVRYAASENLACIDADCIAEAGWVEAARWSIEAGHPISSGPVLDILPVRPIAWVDNRCQFADFQRRRPAGPIEYVPGCNLALSKKLWDELNGFPEDVITGEDGLFSIKFKTRDLELRFNPELIVRHHGRNTLREFKQHQASLGLHRGWLGLFVSNSLEHMGRNRFLVWAVILRRLAYFGFRTFQYDKAGILRYFLSIPLFLIGLSAWAHGFQQGINKKKKEIE